MAAFDFMEVKVLVNEAKGVVVEKKIKNLLVQLITCSFYVVIFY